MSEFHNIQLFDSRDYSVLFELQDEEGHFFIKKELKKDAPDEQRKMFLNEITLLNEIHSEYVIPIIEYNSEGECPFFIMPKANSNLEKYLKTRHGYPEIWIIDQLIQGVQALHDKKILHLDLNPRNVLVFTDVSGKKCIKISDLDHAVHTNDVKNLDDTGMPYGTLTYSPPRDMHSIKNADYSSDIYNIGKIIHHVLTGKEFTYSSDFLDESGLFGIIVQRAVFEDDDPYYKSTDLLVRELVDAKKYEELFPYFIS